MNFVQVASSDIPRFLALRRQGFLSDPNGLRYAAADDEAIGEYDWIDRLRRD